MSGPIRLNKALKELNISLDRAVEFLSSNKIKIDARPTTKIDQKIYDLLSNEFEEYKSEKNALDKINIQKRKEIEAKELLNQEIEVVKDTEVKKDKAEPLSEIKKEKPDKPDQNRKDSENPEIDKENKNSNKIETNFKKLSGLKKTGEILDLKSIKKDKKEQSSDDAKKRRRKRISKGGLKDKKEGIDKEKSNFKKNINISLKVEPKDDEIQKQVRETLEKLQGKSSKSKGAKHRKDKRDQRKQKTEEDIEQQEKESKKIQITEFITVGEIASLMDITSNDIISACMSLGVMVTMNQRLDAETLTIVADEFGYELQFVKSDLEEKIEEEEKEDEGLLEKRPPIITVMGHVDHGKTSLLDFIRKSNIAKDESGGITQHIGAYSVEVNDSQKITFLDTPGHEAFTAMRARGAQITDIVIVIIAADDNIMPQTKEAISHAQAANVPMIFAINKIDKENANSDKVKESLASMNLLVEDWGGKIQSQDISALSGKGVDLLLEKVLLESDIMDLKANSSKRATGTVLEAYLDKGRGYVSTILVQNGKLSVGDYILAGKNSSKIFKFFIIYPFF